RVPKLEAVLEPGLEFEAPCVESPSCDPAPSRSAIAARVCCTPVSQATSIPWPWLSPLSSAPIHLTRRWKDQARDDCSRGPRAVHDATRARRMYADQPALE